VSGLQVLHQLRSDASTQALPVVVLTTSSEAKDISESYRLGANSFVRKSLAFPEFLTAAKILARTC
jgi:two-component system response regulator